MTLSIFFALTACTQPKPDVLFVGIDGATWKVIGPMLERGELKTFRRFVEEGAWLPEFDTMAESFSPLVLTSVATGRLPQDHGIKNFISRLPSGKRIPVSSDTRRVKAIWNVATENAVSVGVIGWWATWPAERVKGYIVGDHANPASAAWMMADRDLIKECWTADEVKLRGLGLDIYPADLAAVAREHWLDRDNFPWDDVRRRSGLSPEQMKALRDAEWYERESYSWWKTFYAVDYPLMKLAVRLRRERPVDLQMIYFRGPDPVQHYSWDLVEPEHFFRKRETFERDRGIVEGVYRYLDTFLAELLAETRPTTWVIVASDHGFDADPGGMDPGFADRPGLHTEKSKGVLFLLGPGVRKGHRLERANPLDLAPTIAWLLGIPVSRELPGKPLTAAFDDSFVAGQKLREVDSWGPPLHRREHGSPVDAALTEQLKALGYIQ